MPSYARPNDEETIRGRIESIPGTFELTLRDDRGFIDEVELHQGTIINPTGLTLADGMSVTIIGRNAGSRFAAVEIDAPYRYAGPAPERVYYGPGWWYPGYAYGYGPSFGLTFVLGGGYVQRPFAPYWPYRGYFHGAYYTSPYYAYPYHGYAYPYHGYAYRAAPYNGVPRAFAGRTFAGGSAYRYPTAERAGAASVRPAFGGGAYGSRGAAPARSSGYGSTGSRRAFSGGSARGGGAHRR